MVKKLSTGIALLMSAIIALAACQTATPTETDCTKQEVICAGLVTGLTGINDRSYTQSAWEGLQQAKNDGLADWIQYVETIDSKDYDQNIATFAEAGYDVIVTVGDFYGDATSSAAQSFPNVLFIGVDQDQSVVLPNLAGLVFHADQAGFMAGALAAQITRTNMIAAVIGSNNEPSMVAFGEGYEAGAKFINPNINMILNYHPGDLDIAFDDPEWGARIAAQAVQNGADVVFGAGGKTGNAALIETASHSAIYCIGVDTDQWDTLLAAHPCLVSSAMKLVAPGVFDLVKLAREGNFPAGNYVGTSGLAPYHDFDSAIPQAVKDKVSQIAAGLHAGSISTGYNPGK